MREYINKWMYFEVIYYKSDFQEINNLESLHPDDYEYVKNNLTNSIYECIDIIDEFLVVRTKETTLRIKPNLIKVILPSPKFKWDDKVILTANPEIKGVVDDLIWHQKDQKYYYQITIDNKKKSKRYDETDLR